jgi:glycosyltransferase involved in cell wall biosynthesis
VRIALVHSFYSSSVPSGENQVVVAQREALESAGHDVELISWSTDIEAGSGVYPARAAWWVLSGTGRDPSERLERFSPDVVHVHNLFPNIGSRWLRGGRWPLVVSIHNYRPVCANGLLYRDGAPCTECIDRSPMAAVRHGCYRGSKVATVPVAFRNRGGLARDALLASADVITLPSRRALDAYKRFLVPEERMRLLPYFVDDVYTAVLPSAEETSWLLASRLSPEKGVPELVKSWPKGHRLDIAGAGPEEDLIRKSLSTETHLLGLKSAEWLANNLPRYNGLVFPGRSPEGIPTMALQALCAGVPVVARLGNGAADLVIHEQVGAVYSDEADQRQTLGAALQLVLDGGAAVRSKARQVYERDFSRSIWLRNTLEIYQLAIQRLHARNA